MINLWYLTNSNEQNYKYDWKYEINQNMKIWIRIWKYESGYEIQIRILKYDMLTTQKIDILTW